MNLPSMQNTESPIGGVEPGSRENTGDVDLDPIAEQLPRPWEWGGSGGGDRDKTERQQLQERLAQAQKAYDEEQGLNPGSERAKTLKAGIEDLQRIIDRL